MTLPSGFFAGQIGALIRLDTLDDPLVLVDATTTQINYLLPSGTAGEWTATLSGTVLSYLTTSAADLPEAGTYKVQAYVEGPGWKIAGGVVEMEVVAPLIPITG